LRLSPTIYVVLVVILSSIKTWAQETDSTDNNKHVSEINLSVLGESITLKDDNIRTLPFRNLNGFGLSAPSAYYLKNNRMFYYGIESQGGTYFIDGMHIKNADDFPVNSIDEYNLYLQKTPIEFGYSLIGISDLQTKIVNCNIEFDITAYADLAQGMSSYNTEFTLGIPLATKKRKMSNKPLVSLFIGGKYTFTNNTDPVWKLNYKLDPAVLNQLRTDPLRPSGTGFGTFQNAEFITAEDFTDSKSPENAGRNGWSLYSKINLPVAKGAALQIGNYSSYFNSDVYDFENAVFNSAFNQTRITKNINSYLSFDHVIQIADDISLNYHLLFQYSVYFRKTESRQHKDRFFEYGYLGNFDTYKTPTFELGDKTVDSVYYTDVWILNSWDYDTLVVWDPAGYNPELAAHTNNYYEFYKYNPNGHYQNIDQILLGGGLVNGSTPDRVYNLWNSPGYQTSNYQEYENQTIRAALKTDLHYRSHTISLGGEFNKETQRSYTVEPTNLWFLIRNLTNFHIRELDTDNPIAISHQGEVDTIVYYRKYDDESQRTFDKNLREALGLPVDGLEFILTDSYDMESNTISYYDKYGDRHTIKTPDNLFELGMFSPQELLNQGFSYVNYSGYDYTGQKQSVTDPYAFFDDYIINAMQPTYGSAYLQDKFTWKNLNVHIGFRIDVYYANRPVLKDKYSLFPIYNIAEAIAKDDVDFEQPGNMDGSYLVYVDRVDDPTRVVGYRNGSNWYNVDGNEIASPDILGDGIGPYLKYPNIYKLGGESWQPDMTFEDYETVINFLPQINIDYTIKDRVNIYVNYNSSTQNPYYINDFRPDLYYYFNNVVETQIIPNPGLKPMRSGKLFTGAKVVLYKSLVADIAFLMTNIDNYYYVSFIEGAYPTDYFTILNNSSRISTEGISASVNYVNLMNSGFYGGFNLTKLFPKESDLNYLNVSALVLNTQLGYRFGDTDHYKGPVWGNNKVLRGLSASLFYQFRKGTPYYYKNTNNVNGIKLTPNFNLFNLNIQKDIHLSPKAVINVFLIIENLLNARNSLEVYPETGLPDDNGKLNDPDFGSNQLNPETFRLLYQMHLNNPAHFDIPRIWRIGIVFSY